MGSIELCTLLSYMTAKTKPAARSFILFSRPHACCHETLDTCGKAEPILFSAKQIALSNKSSQTVSLARMQGFGGIGGEGG